MRELSLLEYEIHEIEEAALTAGEDEVLETKYRKLLNGKKIMEAIHAAHGLLSMEDGSASELTPEELIENCHLWQIMMMQFVGWQMNFWKLIIF